MRVCVCLSCCVKARCQAEHCWHRNKKAHLVIQGVCVRKELLNFVYPDILRVPVWNDGKDVRLQ